MCTVFVSSGRFSPCAGARCLSLRLRPSRLRGASATSLLAFGKRHSNSTQGSHQQPHASRRQQRHQHPHTSRRRQRHPQLPLSTRRRQRHPQLLLATRRRQLPQASHPHRRRRRRLLTGSSPTGGATCGFPRSVTPTLRRRATRSPDHLRGR